MTASVHSETGQSLGANARKRIVFRLFWVGFVVILLGLLFKVAVPYGMTKPQAYFAPLSERTLQDDERGQLIRVRQEYSELANRGDDFIGWNTDVQDFWKYTIAFSAYGVPSLMMIDPDNQDEYRLMLDNMIWTMKSRRVWGDFTDRGFGSDPISHQNIMYKGHLNLMYGLYQLTTGDQRYAREYSWLTQQLADELRLHHAGQYEGVTCEPNAWFVECNVIGMMSLHVYDTLYGTNFTDNEVQWTIDFIFDRMQDPDTGLFYRSYHPQHDVVSRDISGYANAWTLTFLNYFEPEKSRHIYETGFKDDLLLTFGPWYASVAGDVRSDPRRNQIATIFGLWAAKEFKDIKTFKAIRNAVDKFGGLGQADGGGLRYDGADSVHINGVILGSKLHVGWAEILNHDWGHDAVLSIPDTSDMTWRDLLPEEIFSSKMPRKAMPDSDLTKRACPNCFWGDYESIRMKASRTPPDQCPVEDGTETRSCGVLNLDQITLQ